MPQKNPKPVLEIGKIDEHETVQKMLNLITEEVKQSKDLHTEYLGRLDRALSFEVPLDPIHNEQNNETMERLKIYGEYLLLIRCHNRDLNRQINELPDIREAAVEIGPPETPPPKPSLIDIFLGNG